MKQHPVSSPPAQSPPPGESDWDPPLLLSPLCQDGLPHLQVSGTFFKKYEGFRDAMQSLKQVWGLRRDGSGPTRSQQKRLLLSVTQRLENHTFVDLQKHTKTDNKEYEECYSFIFRKLIPVNK